MYTFNALTDEEVHFYDGTSPEYAVAYAYCEENHLMSALFYHCHALTLPEFYKTLPMIYGRKSVGCGDWMAKKEEN